MNRVLPVVFLLHPDRGFTERVRRACVGRYELRTVADWPELAGALRGGPARAVVVADPYDRRPRPGLATELRALLAELPSTTVVAACALRRGCFEDVRTLGEWGITRVISLEEEDTPLALARVLESCQGRPLRSLLHRSLPDSLSARGRAIAMAAAEVVSAGGLGRDLARRLSVTPRTLQRWCRRSGLPAPRQLLAWMRLLLAAELLDDPGRSVLGVALSCGYSTDAALRNAFRAFLDRSPSGLRRDGAFRLVAAAFLEALRQQGAASARSPGGARDDVIPLAARMRRNAHLPPAHLFIAEAR